MCKVLFFLICPVFAGLSLTCPSHQVFANNRANFDLIPKPTHLEPRNGHFQISDKTYIATRSASNEILQLSDYLSERINESTGFHPKVVVQSLRKKRKHAVHLILDESLSRWGNEGYILNISKKHVVLKAPKPAGIFYGIQTLCQLMNECEGNPCKIPGVEIKDKPAFQWRGMLLDCCRHFMTVDFVKRYIDLLAYHKMNVFHWHLTEDQGWRIEIKKYPLLTQIGAWRNENGTRYGGFYSQEEIKDIVAYAKNRYVNIVPEIDIPGHTIAALAAYPQYSCTGKPMAVESDWGVFKDVLCPGKEETFEFIENILTEICELFPSPYIHIGGDEVPKYNWERCPDCQKRIKDEGLEDEHELQGYFTKRIEQFLLSKGRQIIGWDEILEGGVSKTAVVQSWRGMDGAKTAASHGNYVISSPWEPVYFYCPQVPEEVKTGSTTINSIDKVFEFKPLPDELTPDQAKYIMGGECCMWCEYTYQFEVDRQMFPRLCAFSEALWTSSDSRDFTEFSKRLKSHYKRLDALDVDYHKPEVCIGKWEPEQLSHNFRQYWWDVTEYIDKAGIYRVNIVQQQTKENIFVKWVALFENNIEVARHTLFTRSQRYMYLKYPLRLEKYNPDATYTLCISMGGQRDERKAAGSIYLRYFKDTGVAIP